jgi:hypothetical protein
MKLLAGVVFLLSGVAGVQAADGTSVVINEIGWMGTVGGGLNDEWIELHNPAALPVYMNNWMIEDESYGEDNNYIVGIKGTVPAGGYFLIESAEACIKDLRADFLCPLMSLSDLGEKLTLKNENRRVVDVAGRTKSAWFAGKKSKQKYSMERTDPLSSGRDPDNWHDNNGVERNGLDKKGNMLNGTPGRKNSSMPEVDRELIAIKVLNNNVPPLIIDYTVPPQSVVSVRIYDRSGLVQAIVNQELITSDMDPSKKGLQASCIWNEKDSYGGLAEPGEYRALLEVVTKGTGKKEHLFSDPIKLKYFK